MRTSFLTLALGFALVAPAALAECDAGGRCCDDATCCSDGRDNDGDTLVDCDDPSCAGIGPCAPAGPEACCLPDGTCMDILATDCTANGGTPQGAGTTCATTACPSGVESPCDDGEDNDGDGRADCDDPDCAGDPACSGEQDCADGRDDDGDGLVDCDDRRDCSNDPACTEQRCSDGVDDDGDGLTDCADVDCQNRDCCPGREICDDLIDNNRDGLIDCEDLDTCIDADACAPPGEVCDDGADNDRDELVDCADPQCVRFPGCPPRPVGTPPVVVPSNREVACVWPPNHWWVCFSADDFAIETTGGCGAVGTRLVGCMSNQPENGPGDGNTSRDCVVEDGRACVRAERAGLIPTDRVYVILAVAVDELGQESRADVVGTIRVPHDGSPASDCLDTSRNGSRTLN